MKFSIIIPAYNLDKYIDNCIESILAQDFSDYEILIINDGSKDNTLSVCEKYARKYNSIQVINKENGGVSSARNLGIHHAQGDYIYFFDGDDLMAPDMLLNINHYIDFHPNKSLYIGEVVIFSDRPHHNDIDTILNEYSSRNTKPSTEIMHEDKNRLFRSYVDLMEKDSGVILMPRCIFLRKELLNFRVSFDESLSASEDYDFFYSYLLKTTSFSLSNITFFFYRINRQDSATNNISYKTILNNLISKSRIYYMIDDIYKRNREPDVRKLRSIVAGNYISNIPLIAGLPEKDQILCLAHVKNNTTIQKNATKLKHRLMFIAYTIFGYKVLNSLFNQLLKQKKSFANRR